MSCHHNSSNRQSPESGRLGDKPKPIRRGEGSGKEKRREDRRRVQIGKARMGRSRPLPRPPATKCDQRSDEARLPAVDGISKLRLAPKTGGIRLGGREFRE